MENEIKVNEYVRTEEGRIGQYIQNEEYGRYWVKGIGIVYPGSVVKHSPNLIDILEVNDICIMSYNGIIFQKFISMDDIVALKMKEYRLLEILTKEQFESISYKVERKD